MPRYEDFLSPRDLLVNDDFCLTLSTFRTPSGIIQAMETLPSDDDSLQQYASFSDNGYQILYSHLSPVADELMTINSDCVGFLTTSDDAAGQGSRCLNKPTTDGGGDRVDADDNDLNQLCAWETMTTLSQYIDDYSDNAGAEDSGDSSYGLMLREYAINNRADDPKTKKLAKDCRSNGSTLQTLEQSVDQALSKEYGDIQDL
ncbi:hypothetical protein BO86DRAFT_399476 [Aspergillus japonicus CBS 114.51]|uniref:Uncharacterized protein n=1 Tax=Aspergillus japonicus CBS 114.51 TaxID=1448312 RepID=A0A8T8X1F9_ASPJA|nr:hypothetical protein BO86DRAFT_399476 [Aspergillus japonicus CBS 114.51]RAH81946.1 hypothetical protein BO86DRAFT_399476 [Aspergillus japonicus CBS 114.51]